MLVLDEPCADVRERFYAGDLSACARDPLLQRWLRVQRRGLRADGAAHTEGVTRAELGARRERFEAVLHAGSAVLDPIARDARARELVAVVADPDGVVLHRTGGAGFASAASLLKLVEGAQWSEAVRGTNAIGTAIVERAPVAVIGGAHFEEQNASLFCYAAPVRDLFGELVCVLDLTGPVALHDAAFGLAVRAATAALELVLRQSAFQDAVQGGLPALARLVERVRGAAFVVDARGAVACANAEARGALGERGPLGGVLSHGGDEGALPLSAHLAELMRAGSSGDRVELPEARLRGPFHVEPVLTGDGRVLAWIATSHTAGSATPTATSLPAPGREALAAIVGDDPALVREKERALSFAKTELPVLLLAETGTGKELFARAIHACSPRHAGPFVALNCAALSDTLLESELFGHAAHAFTGASPKGVDGKLQAASGGTLFLDEVADMPRALQAALLRFLDDGSYFRVGETKSRRADVRLVCATSRDLVQMTKSGAFREDLFYRIQGACLRPPPLRKRGDRVQLAEHLLRDQGGAYTLTRSAAAYVARHDWPGNVRELKSALAHAQALAPGHLLEAAHFPESLLRAEPEAPPPELRPVRSRESVLRDAVEDALRSTGGNLSEAARRLRMARSTLYRILGK
jgi:sigma-54 dependent transcriptional regulator, acetoin dehydrogenase operon transcriptional activator AcoR